MFYFIIDVIFFWYYYCTFSKAIQVSQWGKTACFLKTNQRREKMQTMILGQDIYASPNRADCPDEWSLTTEEVFLVTMNLNDGLVNGHS